MIPFFARSPFQMSLRFNAKMSRNELAENTKFDTSKLMLASPNWNRERTPGGTPWGTPHTPKGNREVTTLFWYPSHL